MSTSHPRFTARIEGSPEIIFDLIADLPNYGRWLTGSEAFGGTTEVSPYPVRLGTTYLDAGPLSQRPGSVTGYESSRSTPALSAGQCRPYMHIPPTRDSADLGALVLRNSQSRNN